MSEAPPPGVDLDVWESLPDDIRAELLRDAQRNGGQAADSAHGHGQDTAAQSSAAPLNPPTAEVNIAQFLATLPPDLRSQVLLTVTPEEIERMPPELRAEVEQVRHQAAIEQGERPDRQASMGVPGGGEEDAVFGRRESGGEDLDVPDTLDKPDVPGKALLKNLNEALALVSLRTNPRVIPDVKLKLDAALISLSLQPESRMLLINALLEKDSSSSAVPTLDSLNLLGKLFEAKADARTYAVEHHSFSLLQLLERLHVSDYGFAVEADTPNAILKVVAPLASQLKRSEDIDESRSLSALSNLLSWDDCPEDLFSLACEVAKGLVTAHPGRSRTLLAKLIDGTSALSAQVAADLSEVANHLEQGGSAEEQPVTSSEVRLLRAVKTIKSLQVEGTTDVLANVPLRNVWMELSRALRVMGDRIVKANKRAEDKEKAARDRATAAAQNQNQDNGEDHGQQRGLDNIMRAFRDIRRMRSEVSDEGRNRTESTESSQGNEGEHFSIIRSVIRLNRNLRLEPGEASLPFPSAAAESSTEAAPHNSTATRQASGENISSSGNATRTADSRISGHESSGSQGGSDEQNHELQRPSSVPPLAANSAGATNNDRVSARRRGAIFVPNSSRNGSQLSYISNLVDEIRRGQHGRHSSGNDGEERNSTARTGNADDDEGDDANQDNRSDDSDELADGLVVGTDEDDYDDGNEEDSHEEDDDDESNDEEGERSDHIVDLMYPLLRRFAHADGSEEDDHEGEEEEEEDDHDEEEEEDEEDMEDEDDEEEGMEEDEENELDDILQQLHGMGGPRRVSGSGQNRLAKANVPGLARFLPILETYLESNGDDIAVEKFGAEHALVLNALVRSSPKVLKDSLKALVTRRACRKILTFENKRAYFKHGIKQLPRPMRPLRLSLRRDHVFEDSLAQLGSRTPEEMRGSLSVMFRGEEGIDAGGVTREWFQVLSREMFKPDYALFKQSADSSAFQPDPRSYVNPEHLSLFRFVGRIIGKALLEGHHIPAHFTRSFYKHVLGREVTLNDMQSLDPQYHKSLLSILEMSDVSSLELTFTTEVEEFGVRNTVELVPNGANINVTNENKQEWVKLVAQQKMTTAIRSQINAFLQGFYEMVPKDFIQVFNPQELELLISGMPKINLDDLMNNTEYNGGYPRDAPQIEWFWGILRTFDEADKARFLMFVTGTSKVPLEGFASLVGMRGIQRFSIHRGPHSDTLLPTAHTCFNQLDLPQYSSEDIMREKLLLAIREGAEGFGFA